jgi:predicted ABC-type ATPase
MEHPEFWIIAGPNGAGKTTCVQREPISGIIPDVMFLNPDDRTLAKLQASGFRGFADAPPNVQSQFFAESADDVFAELTRALQENKPVGVETVLSTPKYGPLVEATIAAGGFVGLIYVALSSAALATQRVKARVKQGGHAVPDDKIARRWERSLDQLAWFAARASAFWVIDNSDSNPQNSPKVLATGKFGSLEHLDADAFEEMKKALSTLSRNT